MVFEFQLTWRLPSYRNISSERNNLIKFTHYNDTKIDSQIVRAKEKPKVKPWWAQPKTGIRYQPAHLSFTSGL